MQKVHRHRLRRGHLRLDLRPVGANRLRPRLHRLSYRNHRTRLTATVPVRSKNRIRRNLLPKSLRMNLGGWSLMKAGADMSVIDSGLV